MSRLSVLGVAAVLVLPVFPGLAAGTSTGPATPQNLYATNGATAIALAWSQPATGTRPTRFQVYEGDSLVAGNTTTHVTIPNLRFTSSHTYSVTAVDRAGRESARSVPISRQAVVGGIFPCGMTPPGGLRATEVTASAVSLAWSNAIPQYDGPGPLVVLVDSAPMVETSLDSARVSGLAPGTSHVIEVARRDCHGQLHASAPLTVKTASGASARPATPGEPTIVSRTNTTVTLSWAGNPSLDPTVRYAVYDGGRRVASTVGTTATITGLWRDTNHAFTVTARDPAGNESPTSTPVEATTLRCDDPIPPVVSLTATPISAGSVALHWLPSTEAESFTVSQVTRGTQETEPIATVAASSAMITGLAPATQVTFLVRARVAGCGLSLPSAALSATTAPGASARPQPPTNLGVESSTANPDNTSTVTLAWTLPAGADPAVEFRLYEGARVLASSKTGSVTLTLPSGPAHLVTVVAVNASGLESPQSEPISFTAPYLPFP
jgi:chitodextrinase